MSNYIIHNGELYHYGVPGMKWGKRKANYNSTGIRAAIARRKNEKVDKSFKEWQQKAANRDSAIELGKKANIDRMAYESNKSDKSLKDTYKQSTKEYKKALAKNTSYHKGAVRSEVGKDISRKYLSEAKKVNKALQADPSNKDLQKKYNDLMSKHDIEREKARRASEVGAKRSQAKANIKRTMTMTVKTAAGTAAVAAGAYAVNRYLQKKDVRVNGKPVYLSQQSVGNIVETAKK